MSTFFTSDTHFRHANIIKFCDRPFRDVEEMDEEMIRRWNVVVGQHDTVYHLGDFCFGGAKDWQNIRRRLNGNICLILGNHDKQVQESLFGWVKQYHEVNVEGQQIVLFHYGMRTWRHDVRGVWQLYGHSHGGLPAYGKSIDVGVDSWAFAPVSFAELKTKLDKREVGKHPKWENYTPSPSKDFGDDYGAAMQG